MKYACIYGAKRYALLFFFIFIPSHQIKIPQTNKQTKNKTKQKISKKKIDKYNTQTTGSRPSE